MLSACVTVKSLVMLGRFPDHGGVPCSFVAVAEIVHRLHERIQVPAVK